MTRPKLRTDLEMVEQRGTGELGYAPASVRSLTVAAPSLHVPCHSHLARPRGAGNRNPTNFQFSASRFPRFYEGVD